MVASLKPEQPSSGTDPLAALLQAASEVRVYVDKASRIDVSGLAEKRLKALDTAIALCKGQPNE